MRVTLSAAVTADGYMDDDSPRRLIISTPGDWEEVYRLRAAHDAILAGAETLRRDDPSLLVRDQAARARRVQAGLKPDIAKVTLTRSGGLSPRLRFFTEGDADRYVFSPGEITGLQNIATVISTSEAITAKYIVTELEKRGIERLMVEGGAEVLRLLDIPPRPLVEREKNYIAAWDQMGFDDEALRAAYERTVMKKQSMDWSYMNGILRRWHEKGLHTAAAIQAGDRDPRPVQAAAPSSPAAASREAEQAREDMERMRRLMEQMKQREG